MKSEFIADNIWREITRSARSAKKPSWVAVAYFAQGASHLLPLVSNSRLVVDASDGAISSGQTCPSDLEKLIQRGVSVYSLPNLHAKVYVFDRVAYVGSANASNRSFSTLIEGVVRTTDSVIIDGAKKFIQKLLLAELTPKAIERLKRIYRSPRIPGGMRSHSKKRLVRPRPEIPRLFVAQTHVEDWSKEEHAQYEKGLIEAKKMQETPRRFILDGWMHEGRCYYRRGDLIIQVLEVNGRKTVSPPGYVRLIRRYPKRSYLYLELRSSPRKTIPTLSKGLGSVALKNIKKLNGRVKNHGVASELLNYWTK